jgi:hypothetical protein
LVFNKIDVIILDSDLNHNGQHYWNIKHQQDKTSIIF